jgi:hypothetical protein
VGLAAKGDDSVAATATAHVDLRAVVEHV